MPHRVFNVVEDIEENSITMIDKQIKLIYKSKDNDDDLFEFPNIHIPKEEEKNKCHL